MLYCFSMKRCQRSRNTSHIRLGSCCCVSVWGDARDPGILLISDWDHVVVFQYEEMPKIQEYFSYQIEIMLLCFSMRRCQRSRNTSRVRLRSCCYVSVWRDARDPGILLASNWNHVVMFQYEEMPEIQEYFSTSDWDHVVIFQYEADARDPGILLMHQIKIMLLCFSMRRCQRSRNTSQRQIEIMLLYFSMRRCQRSRNTSRVRLRSCCCVSVWGDARDPGILLMSD